MMRTKSRAKRAIKEPKEPSKPSSSSSDDLGNSDEWTTDESDKEKEEASSPSQQKEQSKSLKEPGITIVESTNPREEGEEADAESPRREQDEEEGESEYSEEETDPKEAEKSRHVKPELQPKVQHETKQTRVVVSTSDQSDKEDVVVVTVSKGKKQTSTTSKKAEHSNSHAKTRAQKKAIEGISKEDDQSSVKPLKKRKIEEVPKPNATIAKKNKEATALKTTKQTPEPPVVSFKKKLKVKKKTGSPTYSHGYNLSKTLHDVFVDKDT